MGMAKYLNKELFLQSMGLVGDETKYGNCDAEHANRSYSTWMGYEIMGSVDDSEVEEDVAEVVRCKDCKYWNKEDVDCVYGRGLNYPFLDDFCSYGERREGE